MKRRSFIRNTGLATAGFFVAPYILPSGRLFAASGVRKANHVVFCLYAGGVRDLETIQKADGNLMPNILNGSEAITSDIASAMTSLPLSPIAMPLQNYGTLFKQFKYAQGPTGHYNGHTTAITGVYTTTSLDLRDHPDFPTIFEYYRKHNSPAQSAMNAWWVSNSLGPYPSLNYSKYPGYGSAYGANFIAPTSLISTDGYDALGNMRTFNSQEQAVVNKIRGFLDNNFLSHQNVGDPGLINPDADRATLQTFITDLFNRSMSGQFNDPWLTGGGVMNNDMYNIVFAEEIIKQFKPELLVVNMQDVDICHSQFTAYCNNLRKADFSVAHLWNTIQNTPGMANDTILIVAPEHGRNQVDNNIIDSYGRAALDHTASQDLTGDQKARDIFCLIAGPPTKVHQGNVITAGISESVEIVPTIANILGFDNDIPSGILRSFSGCNTAQAFL